MSELSIDTQRIASAGVGVSDVGASLAREIATMHDLLGPDPERLAVQRGRARFAAAMEGHLADATVAQGRPARSGHRACRRRRSGSPQTEFALADAIPAVA